jgi:hypothetical protein
MSYYDGMGNDKTIYVLGLERRIKELEATNQHLLTQVIIKPEMLTVETGVMDKPKSSKEKKVK